MAREIELKLALPASARRAFLRHPVLKEAAAVLPTQRLVNIYFDTPDLELRDKRMALRLRKIGKVWLQTVKCAGVVSGGLASRPEWEQPYDGHAFDFSAVDIPDVQKRLEKAQYEGRLVPVFETNFLRRTWCFEPAPGSRLLLVLDEGMIEAAGRQLPISELEIEISEGDTGPLFELARRLAERLPLRPDDRSKAERGYRLFTGAVLAPRHASPSPLKTTDTPLSAFCQIAFACLAHLQGNEEGVLESEEAEFVHQMRVALRRLRSALRIFGPALPAEFVQHFSAPLRDLASALGAARDWDVALDEILAPVQRACPGDPRLKALAEAAGPAHTHARSAAREAVAAPEYGRLLLELVSALHHPGLADDAPAVADLAAFAKKRLRQIKTRVAKRAEVAASLAPQPLHALRITCKRLRYAREFFAPLDTGKRGKHAIAALTELQTVLGRLNDLSNAAGLFAQLANGDLALHEAMALVEGWQRSELAPLMAELPARLTALKSDGK